MKPSFVIILADDLGFGDLGCFGSPDAVTPAIDALAGQGLRLTQHYAGSPVCAPSRASLLTGRCPHRTGAVDTLEGRGLDRLALRERTLADELKAAGYATGLFGKWHLGALDPRYHPNRRGFDEFLGFRGGWSDYWRWNLDANGSPVPADGRYLTDVVTDAAVAFIRRHAGRPFFLHVTYNAPHFPLQAPDEDVAVFREHGLSEGVSVIRAMVRRMDCGVERILDALARAGVERDTLVLFTSDNGPQSGPWEGLDITRWNGGFNGCKGLVYEGGIRVPAVVRWPEGLQGDGRECGVAVHFADWLPTLLEAAGVRRAGVLPLDGDSVLGQLRGGAPAGPRTFVWQWNRYAPVGACNAALRQGDWKLVRPVIPEAMHLTAEDVALDRRLKYEPELVSGLDDSPLPAPLLPAQPPRPRLFDLRSDPGETEDLWEREPERGRRMLETLESRMEALIREWEEVRTG